MARRAIKVPITGSATESARDVSVFPIRPQHLKLYKQYANIYEEEETERSMKWERFLAAHRKPFGPDPQVEQAPRGEHDEAEGIEIEKADSSMFEAWEPVRPSLWPVECVICHHLEKSKGHMEIFVSHTNPEPHTGSFRAESPNKYASGGSDNESDEEFYDAERSDMVLDGVDSSSNLLNETTEHEESWSWKEELDALIRGGVPMALRGEVWQVFVGSSACRLQEYYKKLLDAPEVCSSAGRVLETWTTQIEKDLPRTFPGHPAFDEDGRNALCRLLRAYVRHNNGISYCQAVNFIAALLLLMMPEENAFWTLTCIIDNYFEGYYNETMLDLKVDQLVLEDLVRLHFPRLVSHFDKLGVHLASLTGPWFLALFLNILPWESALRVWDILLYEKSRAMLFRTTLALFELHGPLILAAKDARDVLTSLRSHVGATFDSSLLVLTACMGYQSINEAKLQELRSRHYPRAILQSPNILSDLEIHDKSRSLEFSGKFEKDSDLWNMDVMATGDHDNVGCGPDMGAQRLLEQVQILKMQLSRALEERTTAMLREEELEAAFMELVKEDNRRLLSARVETLETEIVHLKRVLVDKEQEEHAMIQVVTRMEHEQHLAQDARRFVEEDVLMQRAALKDLQAKYDDVLNSLKAMEQQACKAEKMLEVTLQSQGLSNGHIPSPKQHENSIPEEEASRWSWPWKTSKPAEVDTSSADLIETKHTGEELGGQNLRLKAVRSSSLDSSQRQNTLSQKFSLAWRERAKGKAPPPKVSASEYSLPASPQSSIGHN